jgi:hypothetical protein
MSVGLSVPKVYRKRMVKVEAIQYLGTGLSAVDCALYLRDNGGIIFAAEDLLWRHDYGTYWHPAHGHIYLPGATRNPNGHVGGPGPRELVVKTGMNTFALVFPGDYIVKGRSGFYPLSEESFHHTHRRTLSPG